MWLGDRALSRPPPLDGQLPLFSSERVVERCTGSGSRIRAVLRPEGDGMVRIVAWYRCGKDGRWQRRRREERVVPFVKLRLSSSWSELFGDADV